MRRAASSRVARRPRPVVLSVAACAAVLLAACEPTWPPGVASGGVTQNIAAAPAKRPAPHPGLPGDRSLRAGFLIVDGVYNTELMAPYDVFHHTRFHARHGIEVFTVSPAGRAVTSFEGLKIVPDHSFATVPDIDILVVASAAGSMDRDLKDAALIDWVRRVGAKARYIVSLCDGAFVLAAAGLLDGHACTTFPGDQDRFAVTFPRLDLKRGVSFVHDDRFLTSQGGARSYDVAMYLVAHLYGDDVAARIGRGLLIPWPPAPGTVFALVTVPQSPATGQ